MTNKYHTPIQAGTPVTAASVNTPMGELDQALDRLYDNVDPTGNLVLDGRWDGRHIVMGGIHIWAHQGRLYWINREPTSGVDGFRFPQA